jgi:hypothetical protein
MRADEIWAAMETLERAGFRSEISGHGDWDDRIWMAAAANGSSTWAAAAEDPHKAMSELLGRLGFGPGTAMD